MTKFVFLLMMIVPTVLQAQPNNDLRGEWSGNWAMTFERASIAARQKIMGSNRDIQEHMEAGIESRRYVFNSDGSFNLKWEGLKDSQSLHGSWFFREKDHVLQVVVNGSSREYAVSFLASGAIALKYINAPDGIALIEVVLVKN